MERQAKCCIREKIKELNELKESLVRVEEDLEDEINDTFSSVSVLLEERRQNLLSQLRSKVGGKCQRVGGWTIWGRWRTLCTWSCSLRGAARGTDWQDGEWDCWRCWRRGVGWDSPRGDGLGGSGGAEGGDLLPGTSSLLLLHPLRLHCR